MVSILFYIAFTWFHMVSFDFRWFSCDFMGFHHYDYYIIILILIILIIVIILIIIIFKLALTTCWKQWRMRLLPLSCPGHGSGPGPWPRVLQLRCLTSLRSQKLLQLLRWVTLRLMRCMADLRWEEQRSSHLTAWWTSGLSYTPPFRSLYTFFVSWDESRLSRNIWPRT